MASRKPAVTSMHEVQATAEGVNLPAERKVSLLGAEFRMADKVGLAPLIKLAVAGSKGVDSNDPAGLVALHDVISDCIDESEHDRFWRHAIDTKADGDELMAVVKEVVEVLAQGRTGSPSGSSPGRPETSANSKESSPPMGTQPPPGMISVDSLLGR